jgi:hypothetical protein
MCNVFEVACVNSARNLPHEQLVFANKIIDATYLSNPCDCISFTIERRRQNR